MKYVNQVKYGRRRKSWTKVICFPLLCNKRCLSWVEKIMSLKQLRSRVQSCFPSTVVSVWLCIQLYTNIFCIITSYHHLKNVYKGKYFATQHIILYYMHMHSACYYISCKPFILPGSNITWFRDIGIVNLDYAYAFFHVFQLLRAYGKFVFASLYRL